MTKKGINWKYTIGEILIVAVGILFAFSINMLSSMWRTDFAYNEIKSSLISDIEANIKSLDRIEKVQQQKKDRLNKMVDQLKSENIDFQYIGNVLFEERKSPTFYPINGAFKSLISQEAIDYFSTDIKKKLFNLYDNRYQRTIYNGNLYDAVYTDLYDPQLMKILDFRTKEIFDKTFLQSTTFRQTLIYVIDEADSYISLVKQSKLDSEMLLELLKEND